jgi:ElaB/YqjD/DUF883 family membrane-anchored ribosome-binding protein
MNDVTVAGKEKLMNDLKMTVDDAQGFVRSTTTQAGENLSGARSRMLTKLGHAKEDIVRLQESTTIKAKEIGRNTNAYVHQNPWISVGIAAGIGAAVGMLLRRR